MLETVVPILVMLLGLLLLLAGLRLGGLPRWKASKESRHFPPPSDALAQYMAGENPQVPEDRITLVAAAKAHPPGGTPVLRRLAALLCLVLAGGCLTAGGVWFWFFHRAQPESQTRELFPGLIYTRDVRTFPRPMVIHLLTVDLAAKNISFVVTPSQVDAPNQIAARTPTDFLAAFHCQAAINANFFQPSWSVKPFYYYPHTGDPVHIEGIAISRGFPYGVPWTDATLYITQDNKASFRKPLGKPYNAVSGGDVILDHGVSFGHFYPGADARTAVGLDQNASHLICIVIDGRQPHYSEGATFDELVEILKEHGVDTAIALDSGSSSAMAYETPSGRARLLSSPLIPFLERPVANHLGIIAR